MRQLAESQREERLLEQRGMKALISGCNRACAEVECSAAQRYRCHAIQRLGIVKLDSMQPHSAAAWLSGDLLGERSYPSRINRYFCITELALDEATIQQHRIDGLQVHN